VADETECREYPQFCDGRKAELEALKAELENIRDDRLCVGCYAMLVEPIERLERILRKWDT